MNSAVNRLTSSS